MKKRIKAEELSGHAWLGGEAPKLEKDDRKIIVTKSEEEQVISQRKERQGEEKPKNKIKNVDSEILFG